MEDKFLFIRSSRKTNPLHQTQAQLCGRQQSQANQYIHLLLPLVKPSLTDCGELPARKMEDLILDEVAERLFVHDGTERAISRPQDQEEQKRYDSGKKKQYTVKNGVLINETCKNPS